MNAECRCAIVWIAAMLRLKRDVWELVDESTGKRCIYSGEVSESTIQVYDYQRSCQIIGRAGALYDSALRNGIQVSVSGDDFYGYDYASHHSFSGRIGKARASLVDAANGQCFEYRYSAT